MEFRFNVGKDVRAVSRFNLIDEPWIAVTVDGRGSSRLVSLNDLFSHAEEYVDLAGDSRPQDFAILRMLLAILQTHFSRVDESGRVYEELEVNNDQQVISDLDEDDKDDYLDNLYETWQRIWQSGRFPTTILDYLSHWHDRFYLFDDKYPFYQVTKDVISKDKLNKKSATLISGKNINRLISESNNKLSLFSPKTTNYKAKLTEAEVARWLLTYQGYTGLADKVIFGQDKYKASKGWLFDLGGIYLKGHNLFETLWLNCTLKHPDRKYQGNSAHPCWEVDSQSLIDQYLECNSKGEKKKDVTDLADLYTNWSRAVYINPLTDLSQDFMFEVVKLPEIEHQDNFLELMTLWRKNKEGPNKGYSTPRKHLPDQALWRSFGILTGSYQKLDEPKTDMHPCPGIINRLRGIQQEIDHTQLILQAISMKDDGNATSWVPVDEICDRLVLHEQLLTDNEGWSVYITNCVEKTNRIITGTYRNFLLDIKTIRGQNSNAWVDQELEQIYFLVDRSFEVWIREIDPEKDSREEKAKIWFDSLQKLLNDQVKRFVENATYRDCLGIKPKDNKNKKGDKVLNVFIAYNKFNYWLKQNLGK